MAGGFRRLDRSWLWMGARSADHTGNAGMYVSGKAFSRAPFRTASPIREQAFGLGHGGAGSAGVAKAAAGIRLRKRVQVTVLPSKKLRL